MNEAYSKRIKSLELDLGDAQHNIETHVALNNKYYSEIEELKQRVTSLTEEKVTLAARVDADIAIKQNLHQQAIEARQVNKALQEDYDFYRKNTTIVVEGLTEQVDIYKTSYDKTRRSVYVMCGICVVLLAALIIQSIFL